MRRWTLPLVLLVIAGGSLGIAVRASAEAAAGAAAGDAPPLAAGSTTPVLSARRAPAVLSQTQATLRLSAGLASAFTDPSLGAGRDQSCLSVSQDGRTLFTKGVDQHLIPASNMKLLTALAALERLGPDTRYTTEVRADRPPSAGVVTGNLYLVGSGDPIMQTGDYNASFKEHALPDDGYTHFEGLAAALVAAGVKQVTGAVVGDESRYDGQRYIPSWKTEYIADAEIGPASALEVNDGFVSFAPTRTVPAPSPAVLSAGSLTALLTRSGVVVAGQPAQGLTPAGTTVVASVQSPPLRTIVAEMLRESDNMTAELLVKELGRRFGGAGTTAAGLNVVRQVLTADGFPVKDLVAVDGSGLDRSDRVTCPLLLAAVNKAGPAGPLAAGLPVAAKSGTLVKRFVGTPAAGRVVAKTGSLDQVSSLSGFVLGSQPPLAFSLVVNGLPRDEAGRVLGDRVGLVLAAYPDAPAAGALGPLP